jgi:transposase
MESMVAITALLVPMDRPLEVRHLGITPDLIVAYLASRQNFAACPCCGTQSRKVHSWYVRTIADLPWRGIPAVLRLEVRRFFCENAECSRLIFVEQFPDLVGRRGRASVPFDQKLRSIGMFCGGEAGARLAAELGMHTSGDTIRRRLRRQVPSSEQTPPVHIGIDDFAFCRGQHYGTVIVDHDTGRVIDLLPERSSESTAAWLAAQPQVQVVTRDRSGIYASGIREGRPDAVQVADRFHLHVNLREAVIRLLDRHRTDVVKAAEAIATTTTEPLPALPAPTPALSEPAAPVIALESTPTISKAAQLAQDRRTRRHERYEQVLDLHKQGMGIRKISRQLGMSRGTVNKFLRGGAFPERAKRHTKRSVDAYADKLRELWDSGIHNAQELHRRIKEIGFRGSAYMVRRLVASWRDPAMTQNTSGPTPKPRPAQETNAAPISSNRLSWLLLRDSVKREPQEQKLIEQLSSDCQPVREAVELAREFPEILQQRDSNKMLGWMDRAICGVTTELKGFAEGLRNDWQAIKAAVELPWSNGRTEGHVNRIKWLKRQMYGRAKFDLLRIRVLARGP